MNLKHLIIGLSLCSVLGTTMTSCGPKDAEIRTEVVSKLNNPGINVDINKGVASIAGTVATQEEKNAIEENVKSIKGVKSVTNNITVVPVIIDTDADNKAKAQAAFAAYPTVQTNIINGEIVLTGTVSSKDELTKVMQIANSLNVGKVNNRLEVK